MKRLLALSIALLFSLPSLCGATPGDVYLNHQGNSLYFGNDFVELVLDSKTGYFYRIRNKQTGTDHKPGDDGVWPFGLWVGTREDPEKMKAEIRADGVQQMTYRLTHDGDTSMLALTYPMLADNRTRRPTGVGLGVEIELAPDRKYFAVRAEIANGGGWWVTNFYAGRGKVLTGDPLPEDEEIHIPSRGGFTRSTFKGMSLGLPTYTWGWMDYSGRRGGIGIAYVNRIGIQLMFDIEPADDGLLESWHLFDTRGYWHFEGLMNDYQKSLRIQPLEPANSFKTDEWLIIPHSGDWHQTADVYRQRYLETFQGDCQSWETLPERVKKLYIQFGFFIAENSIGNSYPRKVITPLDKVVPSVRAALDAMGLDPEHAGVNLVFFHPHVGRYPEFFPVWEAAGGDKGMEKALAGLHEMGIDYVLGYAHLAYDHPAAENYVLEADTMGTVPFVNPTAGNRACVDNSAWIHLWQDQLIPAYKARGFDGVFADEGHFPWGTCTLAGTAHLHGTTAVGILTANTRGIVRLHKLVHAGLGHGSVIDVEGSGDVAGRWADLNNAYPDPALAFTLPFWRYAWFTDALTPELKLSEHINLALAHGYPLLVNLESVRQLPEPGPLHRYVTVRRQLEQERVPGYPEGFRDAVGLHWDDSNLQACAFRDRKSGITVVYYATGPVDTDLEVNGAELDLPGMGTQRRHVRLNKDQIDFWILRSPTDG